MQYDLGPYTQEPDPQFRRFLNQICRKDESKISFFHYTSIESVKGIIDSGQFWMTHYQDMEDEHELFDGIGFIQKAVAEFCADHLKNFFKNTADALKNSEVFVLSVSNEKDSQYHWNNFVPKNGIGCCIQLPFWSDNFKHCLYCDRDKLDLLDSLMKAPAKTEGPLQVLFGNLIRSAASMKKCKFKDEREYRYLRTEYDHGCVFERVGPNGKTIRFIKSTFDVNDIEAIWIGPCQEPEGVEKELLEFLESKEKDENHDLYAIPPIKHSSVPLEKSKQVKEADKCRMV